MILQLAVTVFLILCSMTMYVTHTGRLFPAGFRIIPLLAAAVYWVVIYIRKSTGKTGISGILLLILFYIMIVVSVPVASWVWIGMINDREKNIPAITIGNESMKKTIYIIYHPGGSPILTNVITKFAMLTGKAGYKTVLYCANKNLKLDLKKADAVGFSSPVYTAEIRPPVENYIKNTDMKGIRTFMLVTCGSNPGDALDKAGREVVTQGAEIIGTEAIGAMEKPGIIDSKLEKFANEIESKLK